MLNKFFKTIHNKYSKFFRFIFFLRYLFVIFVTFTALFLTIPIFFDYEKRAYIIKQYLLQSYDLEIKNYDKIQFKSLPLPNLEFKNVILNLNNSSIKIKVKSLKIFPKFFNIYNYEDFQTNKIILDNSDIILETSNLSLFSKKFLNQKKNLFLNNLDLKIYNKKKLILKSEDIKFANYGYKANIIYGKIFGKRFKTQIDKSSKKINFKLFDTGITAEINIKTDQKSDIISGVVKSKILKTNFKFDFDYDERSLNIYNSYFRSKNLSFKNNSLIILDPFLDIKSNFEIEEFNEQIFENISWYKIFALRDFIKKINSKNEIKLTSKKIGKKKIDNLYFKIDTVYGRINYFKKFSLSENLFQCEGNINLLEEFPVLLFDCLIEIKNKKKFLKEFSIKSNENNQILKLNFEGNLSILNKKIYFSKIHTNKNYDASKEDLIFFKEAFEKILFNESFLEIFKLKKIKKFIKEVS